MIAIASLIAKRENRDGVNRKVYDSIGQLSGPLEETIGTFDSVWDAFKEYVLSFVEARKTE